LIYNKIPSPRRWSVIGFYYTSQSNLRRHLKKEAYPAILDEQTRTRWSALFDIQTMIADQRCNGEEYRATLLAKGMTLGIRYCGSRHCADLSTLRTVLDLLTVRLSLSSFGMIFLRCRCDVMQSFALSAQPHTKPTSISTSVLLAQRLVRSGIE